MNYSVAIIIFVCGNHDSGVLGKYTASIDLSLYFFCNFSSLMLVFWLIYYFFYLYNFILDLIVLIFFQIFFQFSIEFIYILSSWFFSCLSSNKNFHFGCHSGIHKRSKYDICKLIPMILILLMMLMILMIFFFCWKIVV